MAELVSSRIQAELVQVGHEIAIYNTLHMADITFRSRMRMPGDWPHLPAVQARQPAKDRPCGSYSTTATISG